jgi:hypothetical protein
MTILKLFLNSYLAPLLPMLLLLLPILPLLLLLVLAAAIGTPHLGTQP